MDPETAAPATDDSDSAAAPQVDSYGFPIGGEMDTNDMSDEQLADYVDKTLGIKGGSNVPPAKTDDQPKEDPVTPPAPPAPPVEEPKPAEEVAETAPEMKTDDLWIEVKDGEGKSIKLSLEDGIPDEFTFTSDKQLFEILQSFEEMKALKKERQTEIDTWNTEHEAKASEAQTQQEVFAAWDQEIKDLIDAKILDSPKLAATDPNFLKDPAVVKVDTVFKYMTDQNTKREADGKPSIRSFAVAYNLYTNDEQTKATADKAKADAELAKKRGAMVGGTSSPTGGGDKSAVYRRGSARNIWQVDTSDI